MQITKPIPEHCAHLGLHDDPLTALAYPSVWNICYRARPPASVGMDYQSDVCLKYAHVTCPVYLAEKNGKLPSQIRGQSPITLRRAGRNRAGVVWGLVVVILAVLAVWWGRQFLPSQAAPTVIPVSGDVMLPTAVIKMTAPVPTVSDIQQALVHPSATPVPTASVDAALFPTFSFGICGHGLDEEFGTEVKFVIHRVSNGESLDIFAEKYQTSQDAIRSVNFSLPVPIWTDWAIVIPLDTTDVDGIPPFEAYQIAGRSQSLSEITSIRNMDEASFWEYNAFESTCRKFSNWLLIPHANLDG